MTNMMLKLTIMILCYGCQINLASSNNNTLSYIMYNETSEIIIMNETIESILERNIGPRKNSLAFTITISLIYILILLFGIIDNICVCFVIIFNQNMHTVTNYYLFSLAISDLLFVSFGLPPEIYSLIVGAYPWAFGNAFCKIKTFVFEATTIVSALTILAFTFERWLHICKPFYAKKFSKNFRRTLKLILLLWFFSSVIALPYSVITSSANYVDNIDESKVCQYPSKYENIMSYLLLFSSVFLFIIPMVIISVM